MVPLRAFYTPRFHYQDTPNGVLSKEIKIGTKSTTATAECTDPKLEKQIKKIQNKVDGLEQYLQNTCSNETPLQIKIWKDTMNENWEENYKKGITMYELRTKCITGKVEGQFLRIIAEMTKAERILEIGMFTGYSAISFAQSSYVKQVVCLEIEPYCEKFMRERIGNTDNTTEIGSKIRVIIGSGLKGLKILKKEGKQFDLIFIDADKVNYIHYYKFIMDNSLIDPLGVFLIDNTLWDGDVVNVPPQTVGGEVLHEFNQYVKNDDRVIQVTVPLRDGVTLIKPKVKGGIYGN